MYAIRQIQQVHNHTVLVHLPTDFSTDRVEVIIFPIPLSTAKLPVKLGNEAPAGARRFLTMDTSQFTAVQRQAYNRACAIIRRGRSPDEPRILGLFAGLMEVADDFDAPLPDEEAFWGQGTDEFGMSLER